MRTVSVAPDAFVRCWRKLKIMLIYRYCCSGENAPCQPKAQKLNEAGETALNTAADTGGTADHSV